MFDLNWALPVDSVTSVGFLNGGAVCPNHVFVVKWLERLLEALVLVFLLTWLVLCLSPVTSCYTSDYCKVRISSILLFTSLGLEVSDKTMKGSCHLYGNFYIYTMSLASNMYD